MGQLKLIPQADRASGGRHIGEKANSHSSTTAERTPPTQRLATEARKDPSRSAEQLRAARMGRLSRTPPDHTPPTPPGFTLASGIRILIAGLILVALVPNLILGAMFWLGAINPPSSKPVTPAPAPAVLTAPATIEATAGEEVSFPIALDGTDGVPARSIIAISGLPQGSQFSDGRPYGEMEWNLKSDQIGDLHLVLPNTANGESKLTIKLISPDDAVIADAETILKVASAPIERAGAEDSVDATPEVGAIQNPNGGNNVAHGMQADLAGAQFLDEPPKERGPKGAEEGFAKLEPANVPPGDPVKSPSDNPGQMEDGDGHANWVEPSVFVNLRDGPSSSAKVVGVIAKGAKLPVMGRKRGWVQVTNPATSEKGWIYSGFVDGAIKGRLRTKRTAPAEPEQKSESFWSNVGQWLSP